MPLNTNIPLMAAQPRQNSLTDSYVQAMQLKGMQQQLSAQERATTRDEARRNALKSAYDPATGAIDYSLAEGQLVGAGDIETAMAIRDQGTKERLASLQAQDAQLKRAVTEIDTRSRIIGSARDQLSYEAARNRLSTLGVDVSGLPEQFDPTVVESVLQEGLDAKAKLEMGFKREQFGETKRHNKATEQNAAANAAATLGYRQTRLEQQDRANQIAAQGVNFKTEQTMADDHRTQSKNFIDVRDAYKRVKEALKTAPTSAPATLAAATSFMKLLDPGSVVRESELGMALAAQGAFDKMTNYFNVLQNGQVLTPSQAREFEYIAGQVYKAAEDGQRQLDRDYKQKAGRYSLNPENVVTEYYPQEAAPPAEGAMQAPDGKWYIKGPDGGYLRVDQ